MPTLEEFNRANETQSSDEDVIVNPNIARQQRSSVAENAARAGFREIPQPNANTQRQVDLVKDLGLKSQRQVAEEKAFENDDIAQALGPQLEAAAERRKAEYEQFKDAFDACGGEMTKEDLSLMTEEPDYSAMLSNPPDPLNSEIKKYNQQQLERFKETASEEELKALGAIPNNGGGEYQPQVETHNSVDEPVNIDEYKKEREDKEDEEIMNDSEEMVIPEVPVNVAAALNDVVEEKKEISHENDSIPIDPTPLPEERFNPSENAVYVAAENNSDGDSVAPSIPKTNEFLNVNIDIDKELESLDFDEDFVDEKEKAKNEERLKKAKDFVKEKVIPIANKMNISGFSISNKPVSLNNSVNMASAATQQGSARWALFATGRPIVMSGFFGYEIDELSRLWYRSNNNLSVSDVYKRYTYFYEHTLSPKPATVEEWLKTISFIDVKHLYATAHKASFEKTNFMYIACSNDSCGNEFISDNKPFEEIVQYENADAKKKAMDIYNSEPSAEEYKLYNTEVVPISNVYAMSFKDPSIYDVEIAPKYLEPDWYERMRDSIAINMYIDKIFVIDAASMSLRPLAIKEFPNDPRKTLKAKVLALSKIIPTLTSDQYNLLSTYIETINKPANLVNYQKPTSVCPECGTKIDAEPSTIQDILFTRHRLTALVNG